MQNLPANFGFWLQWTIIWIVIPIILLGLFAFGISLERSRKKPQARRSARAGYWAGMLLFVMFVIYEGRDFHSYPRTSLGAYLNLWAVLVSAASGFALLRVAHRYVNHLVISFIIMALISSSLSGLVAYLFMEDFRQWIVSGTLGFSLGALLLVMISPQSIEEIYETGSRKPE